MRITVFGAAGDVGSRIVKEAVSRGHTVKAVVRKQEQLKQFSDKVKAEIGFANRIEDVTELSKGQDLIVSAVRPASGYEAELASITQSILTGANQNDIRSLIVGGAASLKIAGKETTVLTEPNFLPESVVSIATACFNQHQACIDHNNQNWAYMSPPAMLRPGVRTGEYRLGKDELLVDSEGNSHISMEDFAVALMDEAEQRNHTASRFTAAY